MTTLTSIKRVGDLQAFSASEECLVFWPAYSHVVLRPWPGYMPMADICRTAGGATPNTFARFYSLCIEPVSSRVLGN
ncbi:hypothetical protein M9458_011021, partial [Cirrhinus mrigala]